MRPEIQHLLDRKLPLPVGTEIYNRLGEWVKISDAALASANRYPNTMSETEPFWLHGWRDLHKDLRLDQQHGAT